MGFRENAVGRTPAPDEAKDIVAELLPLYVSDERAVRIALQTLGQRADFANVDVARAIATAPANAQEFWTEFTCRTGVASSESFGRVLGIISGTDLFRDPVPAYTDQIAAEVNGIVKSIGLPTVDTIIIDNFAMAEPAHRVTHEPTSEWWRKVRAFDTTKDNGYQLSFAKRLVDAAVKVVAEKANATATNMISNTVEDSPARKQAPFLRRFVSSAVEDFQTYASIAGVWAQHVPPLQLHFPERRGPFERLIAFFSDGHYPMGLATVQEQRVFPVFCPRPIRYPLLGGTSS